MFSKKATKIDEIFTVDLTLCIKCQIDGEDFVNFCGLLRKHELYQTKNRLISKCLFVSFRTYLSNFFLLELLYFFTFWISSIFKFKFQVWRVTTWRLRCQPSGSGTRNCARTSPERFAHRPLGKSAIRKLYPSANPNPAKRVSQRKSASHGLRKTVVRTHLL